MTDTINAMLVLENNLPCDLESFDNACREPGQLAARSEQEIVEWLADREHAAVVKTTDGPTAIFPSAGDEGWYWQTLPMEDPGDATWADDPTDAIRQLRSHDMI